MAFLWRVSTILLWAAFALQLIWYSGALKKLWPGLRAPLPDLPRLLRLLLGSAAISLLGLSIYWSVLHYRFWAANEFTSLFLPPHQPISYFLLFVGRQVFLPWLLSGFGAFLLYWALRWLNERYGERFFEREEYLLGTVAFAFSGYPACLFFIPVMLAAGLALSIFYAIFGLGRAPLYYLWLPAAIFSVYFLNYWAPAWLLRLFAI